MMTDCSKLPYPSVTLSMRIGVKVGVDEILISEFGLIVIVAPVRVGNVRSQLRAHGTRAPDDTAILVIL